MPVDDHHLLGTMSTCVRSCYASSASALSSLSSSSSSSSSSSATPGSTYAEQRRQCLVRVATHNSSTFLSLPSNSRLRYVLKPVVRPDTSLSLTTTKTATDIYSVSNHSRMSSIGHTHPSNPILNNPLLNHRKKNLAVLPAVKSVGDPSSTARRRLLSKASQRTHTRLQHGNNTTSSQVQSSTSIPIRQDDEQTARLLPYLDEIKFDLIARWLKDVRVAIQRTDTCPSGNTTKKTTI
jgi:hypothetical protein